jgi:thiamine pyrophosphate-dependent acetolactate synthase large subunit-like protein
MNEHGKRARVEPVNRRNFLKGAATGAAAGAAALLTPATPLLSAAPAAAAPLTPMQAATIHASETGPLSQVDAMTVDDPGSDFMVDVFKTLGFEYVAANPASSFRGLHESFVTYGQNASPEWLTLCHEEAAANMANGYYAVSGRPMAVITFAPAGLQHATMGIFGAYTGHTPTYVVCGNYADAAARRPGTDWAGHSVTDPAVLVRDFVKWDDAPASLQHFAESAVRAYKMAMTEPRGPVLLVVDASLQENPVSNRAALHIPRLTLTSPPVGEAGAIAAAAALLVNAETPMIVAGDVARDEEGMRLLVELAETLQAPVQSNGRDMPNRHPLRGGNVRNADVILGLNDVRFYGALHRFRDQQIRTSTLVTKPGAKIISVSSYDLYMKGNYQNVDRYTEVDLSIGADPQATLPGLIDACKRLMTPDRRRTVAERGRQLAVASARELEQAHAECASGWDASPISRGRLALEVWDAIRHKDWAAVGDGGGLLWENDTFYRTMGNVFGGGVGGELPIAIGGALAHRTHGRLCVAFQPDGDMMYVSSALWTATHHRIPLLLVMHNNRAYHQEVMHLQRMASRRQRGITSAGRGFPGTTLRDPDIDFAQLARSMGAYAEGPISHPKDLRPAILRAVARVERGDVAVLDTITQPR